MPGGFGRRTQARRRYTCADTAMEPASVFAAKWSQGWLPSIGKGGSAESAACMLHSGYCSASTCVYSCCA